MQPSSLIFLVLIGIWAAYLLQHWVRRREHLATARSVDRFSDAMRVLKRRAPPAEFELSGPRPRSYAISSARHSPLEVAVKRVHSVRPDVSAVPVAGVRPTRVFHILAGVSARRLRGLSLLASLSLALVVLPLSALSLLPWWSVLVVVATVVVDLAWLRRVALSERAARRAPAQAHGAAADPADQAASDVSYFEDESQPQPQSEYEQPQSESESESAAPVPAPMAEIAEPIESPAQASLPGWAPVPVPPPTYTLKAKAADPVHVPVVVTEPGAAECWSLDGMIYDCELDELVEVRSATGT